MSSTAKNLKFIDPKKKLECNQCHALKLPLHFYLDKVKGRISRDCCMCRRRKSNIRQIPNLDVGAWMPVQSGHGGPGVMQFVRRSQ